MATLYDDLNQYQVVMELDPRQGSEPGSLEQARVITASGERVPLAAFATWRYGLTRDRIFHDSQFAAMGIDYGLAPGVTLQQARASIDRAVSQIMLPASIFTGEPTSDGDGLAETLRRQPWLILGVLVAVYLVLGVLYESLVHPLTIISTLPPAGLGALLALRLSGTEFSLIALLGLFLLIGVVMKNAILLIDFALAAERRQGLAPRDAIRQAAHLRPRPILMTNLAALLGAVPLVLGFGEGSEMRRPLGIAIIGGLAVSQLQALRALRVATTRQRVLEEHALALLTGRTPAQLAIAADMAALPAVPDTPAQLPSALLVRRPDVAAAERQVAAANARLGAARSAWLPDLSLGVGGALQSGRWSDLFDAPVRIWSLGPTLAATLFDGGARRAEEARSLAVVDEQAQAWRAAVLQAVRDTEDALASLRSLAELEAQQRRLVALAEENERVVNHRYEAGMITYLEVATAQTLALDSRRTALDVQAERLLASMQLIAALGGGWHASPPLGEPS